MNLLNRVAKKVGARTAPLLLWGLWGGWANAAVLDINAVFKPDSSAPHKNEFVNKTPSEGFCHQLPLACEPEGLFSLFAPIRFTANAPILANHADPRQGAMTRVPSTWRDVTVSHESGETRTLKLRIAGIGHSAQLPRDVSELTGGGNWNDLWRGGAWINPPAPCQGVGWSLGGSYVYASFWKVPENAGVCFKQALFDIPLSFIYQNLMFGYQLKTPDPLLMKSGRYTGSITFGVGPGQDFDLGDVMQPDDSALTLNFDLDVQHTLKVDIPPGGEKVQLVPAGGWQSWLQAGRRPVNLFRDQTFNISASSRFKMFMECEFNHVNNQDCVLDDRVSRRGVRLQVRVSLPSGLTDMAGQPVRHLRLGRGVANALYLQPSFYVDRAPGILHFEVPQSAMEFMLAPGAGPFYRGKVTVIWDSEI